MCKMFMILLMLLLSAVAWADQVTVKIYSTENSPKLLGNIVAQDTRYGLLLIPDLQGLPHGMHGFHLHENPSCKNSAQEAGEHFDPQHTNRHLGPYNAQGHLGDLPMLYVNRNGVANVTELAPRLSVAQIRDHAFVILTDSDSYSDSVDHHGGGGEKIACGVVGE